MADTDHGISADAVRQALSDIALPENGTLADSSRLTGIRVEAGGRISFAITIAPEEAETFAAIRSAAETAIRSLAGATQVLVVLTAERDAAATAPRPTSKPEPKVAGKSPLLPDVAHVVAVASGKGGVGKSTTAINLALGLRAAGLKVGILDADIYGPSLPTLLGLRGSPQVGPDRRLKPLQAHGVAAMSIGFLVDEETAMVWRGPMVMSAITQMLAEVDWGTLDVLLVDMPPGTGDAQLAIAQSVPLAGAVIVSTPQDLALIDARRGIAMFRKVDVPIIGLIENMAHFVCPDCGARHDIFGSGGTAEAAGRLGVPFLGAVPLTIELRTASDLGRPITALSPDSELGLKYQELANSVIRHLKGRN